VLRAYTRVGLTAFPGGTVPPSLTVYLTTKSKTRTKATPYGFGVDWATLSPSRLAILAALGIIRT